MAYPVISQQILHHLLILTIYLTLFASFNMEQPKDTLSDEFIEYLNRQNFSWKARRNFPKTMTRTVLKKLLGAADNARAHKLIKHTNQLNYRNYHVEKVPSSFDARDQWPNCRDFITQIGNQGQCPSSWAFSVASAASDRLCIQTVGQTQILFSAQHLIECCRTCRVDVANGCGGGYELEAWSYWVSDGMVSGSSNILDKEGCKPYSPFVMDGITPVACHEHCTNPRYDRAYRTDLTYGGVSYTLPTNPLQIQLEIMNHGPVTTRVTIYEEFYTYERGFYNYTGGEIMGKHNMKIIGWGVQKGKPYWLLANSWGKSWGEGGLVKIPRGDNYLGVEEYVTAGRVLRTLDAREYLVNPNATAAATAYMSNVFVVLNAILLVLNK